MTPYEVFTLRNKGYINQNLQSKIKNTKVLIAGCGMGSAIAEVMLRSGFVNLILADADEVAPHNLNRQCFINEDIGKFKTASLSKRLKSIYPDAVITEFNEFVNPYNANELVDKADLIVDTIDFIDLVGVTSLYDAASQQSKPVISAINAGFGAIALYFPHTNNYSFRQLFDLPNSGSVEGISYSEKYMGIVHKLAKHLNPQITTEMENSLGFMEDGKPCPASQIAPGSFTAGTLAATIAIKILSNEKLASVPNVIMLDLAQVVKNSFISLNE